MRQEKVVTAIDLARELASSADGLTIDEISNRFGVARRTAERMKDVVEQAFGPLDRIDDGRRVRFRLSAGGIGRFVAAPTAEELAELINLARAMEARDPARAKILGGLAKKVGASLNEQARRRLAPDIDAQLKSEVWAHTAGPVVACRPEILRSIRSAILSNRKIDVAYRKVGDAAFRLYTLTPWGIIWGVRHYLVAGFSSDAEPRMLRLDRIDRATLLDAAGDRASSFDLRAFSQRSFGLFQEPPQGVELVFAPEAAEDVRNTLFHPSQRIEAVGDGGVRVCFEAGGLRELADFLRSWRGAVRVLAPEQLATMMAPAEVGPSAG